MRERKILTVPNELREKKTIKGWKFVQNSVRHLYSTGMFGEQLKYYELPF